LTATVLGLSEWRHCGGRNLTYVQTRHLSLLEQLHRKQQTRYTFPIINKMFMQDY